MLEAIANGRVIEEYLAEKMMLICGTFLISENVTLYLHVVCEYADPIYVEFVTAYIPDDTEWKNPPYRRRRRIKR